MNNDISTGASQDWRHPGSYTPMLSGNRRALAWQCLRRDQDFLETTAAMAPAAAKIIRGDPPITVVTLSEENRFASWGLLFRAGVGPDRGGGLCRLGRRQRPRRGHGGGHPTNPG